MDNTIRTKRYLHQGHYVFASVSSFVCLSVPMFYVNHLWARYFEKCSTGKQVFCFRAFKTRKNVTSMVTNFVHGWNITVPSLEWLLGLFFSWVCCHVTTIEEEGGGGFISGFGNLGEIENKKKVALIILGELYILSLLFQYRT